jgi:hypothetical protein
MIAEISYEGTRHKLQRKLNSLQTRRLGSRCKFKAKLHDNCFNLCSLLVYVLFNTFISIGL